MTGNGKHSTHRNGDDGGMDFMALFLTTFHFKISASTQEHAKAIHNWSEVAAQLKGP